MSKETKTRNRVTGNTETVDTMMDVKGNTKPEEFVGHLEDSPDFKQFLEICKLTGQLTDSFENLSLEEKKGIEVGYHQWVKAERPKPTMPDLVKAKVEYPIDIWIANHKGKKFMYYDTNLGKKHWIEEKNGKIMKYMQEATPEALANLLKEREELCPIEQTRSQYVVIGTQVHLIQDETDLSKTYEELVKIARSA